MTQGRRARRTRRVRRVWRVAQAERLKRSKQFWRRGFYCIVLVFVLAMALVYALRPGVPQDQDIAQDIAPILVSPDSAPVSLDLPLSPDSAPVSPDLHLSPDESQAKTQAQTPVILYKRTAMIPTIGRCINSYANLRDAPGQGNGSRVVTQIKAGALALITGYTTINNRIWYEVEIGTGASPEIQTLWVSSNLVRPVWSASEQKTPWAQVITQIARTSGFTPSAAIAAFGQPVKSEEAAVSSAPSESGESNSSGAAQVFQRLSWSNLSLEYLNGSLTGVNVNDGRIPNTIQEQGAHVY